MVQRDERLAFEPLRHGFPVAVLSHQRHLLQIVFAARGRGGDGGKIFFFAAELGEDNLQHSSGLEIVGESNYCESDANPNPVVGVFENGDGGFRRN